jgi:TIR domain
MKRVFVSYSRNNLEVVTQLIQDLQAVGVQTWHDQTLSGGQRWWDTILQNLRDCDIFVFALSPESWASEACRSELAYVSQLTKVVLPVLVADGINLNLLPPPINDIQVTDYRGRDKEAAFALVKSINMAQAPGPMPDPLPPSPRVPVSYFSSLKERLDSAEPLNAQEQISLMFELEAGMREDRSPAEIRDLLLTLKRRDDLLAKIAMRIDEALSSLEGRVHTQRIAPAAATPSPGPTAYASCAGPVTVPISAPASDHKVPNVARSESRRYSCTGSYAAQLITDVTGWLDDQGFDCQQMNTNGTATLLQIKKRGSWRDFVGMGTALNIAFSQSGDILTVEIGAGKWFDKAAVGTVSIFILWPLAVTAGLGAWEQMKMPDKIFTYIATRFVYA